MSDAPLNLIERLAKFCLANPWWVVSSAVATIFATVVSIMAIPSILQTFFGGPKIRVQLKETNGVLVVWVLSARIKSRFLRAMRVYRTHPDVSADFRIYDAGSNKAEKGLVRPLIGFNNETKPIVTINSWLPAILVL